MSSRPRSAPAASACSAPCSRPIPISAASSPAASSPARSGPTRRSRCSTATAISSSRAGCRESSPFAASSARRSTRPSAGDIVAIAGLEKFNVADTLCSPEEVEPLHAQPIDPPTLSMTFSVNDSPLAGTEGDKVTSRVIRDRLFKEAEGNVALRVEPAPEFRRLRRLRPRRIAARDPDRDHAPRGLRARRVAPEGALPPRRGRASCSSRSRRSSSTSTRSTRASSCRR